MDAATAVTTIGALITALGAGVYIQTKWFSNIPSGTAQAPRLNFSWQTVAVGLTVLAAGILIIVLQKGVTGPVSGPGGGGTPNVNVNGGSAGSAPDSPTGDSPTGQSPSAPAASNHGLVTYIENLQTTADSDPFDTQGIAQVDGNSYPHSEGAQFCAGSNERKWKYVLSRKYSSFQGTIGLSDNSVSTANIRFEVLADGQSVYSRDLRVGQSAALNVPVSNVLQLEIDTTLLTNDGGCGSATGEWANIRAIGP